jgi:hypothetical protein
MDLGQLAHHHDRPIAKNFDELEQRSLEALRGFEDDQRETNRRGSANKPNPRSSFSRQEPEHDKWTIDQPRSAHGCRQGGGTRNRRHPIPSSERSGHEIRPWV